MILDALGYMMLAQLCLASGVVVGFLIAPVIAKLRAKHLAHRDRVQVEQMWRVSR